MITTIHRFLPGACRRVAFYYDDEGAPTDKIEAAWVRLPDGSQPKSGDVMTCGSCGREIGPEALDFLPGELNVKAKR